MGIGQAFKLMKDKTAIAGIVGFHDSFFRYMVHLKYDRLNMTAEDRDKIDRAFLASGEVYIEVLQKVGMIPDAPAPADNDPEILDDAG